MTSKQIASAEAALENDGYTLSFRASLWAYFVLHSLRFLRPGGRIAWVLPRSLSQSFYGRELLQLLRDRFSFVGVISLEQRMFTSVGTEELTDILLATDFTPINQKRGHLAHFHAKSLSALEQLLADKKLQIPKIQIFSECSTGSRNVALSDDKKEALNSIYRLPQAKPLSDLIDIRIGLVTGASNFFILRKSAWQQFGLKSCDFDMVISKYRQASGLEVTETDLMTLASNDERIFLLNCSQPQLSTRVENYLASFDPGIRDKIATFKKRTPWHHLDDKNIPDALLPCLVIGGPRMVLNTAQVNCTNNMLRVWFKEGRQHFFPKLLALSLSSTIGQLSAEVFGRACGSGGLKLEPSDWLSMKVLLPDTTNEFEIETAFNDVSLLLKSGKNELARLRADQFIIQSTASSEINSLRFDVLTSALEELKNNRK